MPAYVVSKYDIDILVTAFIALKPTRRGLSNLGCKLWRENVASVCWRYSLAPGDLASPTTSTRLGIMPSN
jgi:hypothetical protein